MIHFDGIIFGWQKGGGVYRYFKELMSGLEREAIPYKLYKPLLPTDMPLARRALMPLQHASMALRLATVRSGIFHSTYFTTYKTLKIPQVVTVHDMTYESFPEYFSSAGAKRHIAAKKKCIEAADAVICISEATKRALLARYPVDQAKIHTVYHGVSETFRPEHDDPSTDSALLAKYGISKPFILFVGKKGLYKNFALLDKAFASWDKKDSYQLVTAGDGGIAPTDAELSALYRLAKAFVFPSLDEGFGLPILEALCSGGRVIASDIPVFREIGLDKPIYFDPRSEQSLLAALDVAHAMPRLSPDERSSNEREVRERFGWDRTVQGTLAVYRKLDPSV